MTKKIKRIGIVFLIILMISLISIGCQNEDGIDNNEDTGVNDDGDQDQDITDEDLTDESKDNIDEDMVDNNDENMDINDESLANSIVEMNGINDATVVTMDEVALVGVDSNGEDKVSDEMKQDIESKIKEENKNINDVYVSNEPDMFDRINTISNNVRNGDPIDDFTDDISEMIDNITPDKK